MLIVILIGLIWIIGVSCIVYSFFEKPIQNYKIVNEPKNHKLKNANLVTNDYNFDLDEDENSVIIID